MLLDSSLELLILAALIVAEQQVTGDSPDIRRQQVACQYEAPAQNSRRQRAPCSIYNKGSLHLFGHFLQATRELLKLQWTLPFQQHLLMLYIGRFVLLSVASKLDLSRRK